MPRLAGHNFTVRIFRNGSIGKHIYVIWEEVCIMIFLQLYNAVSMACSVLYLLVSLIDLDS